MMKPILEHRPNIAPTQSEIKQVIIQRLLDIEYPPCGGFYENDRDKWDTERQLLVLRMDWNTKSAITLLLMMEE